MGGEGPSLYLSPPLCDSGKQQGLSGSQTLYRNSSYRSELTRSSNEEHRVRRRAIAIMIPVPGGSRSSGTVRVQAAGLPSWPWSCHSMQYVRPGAWAGQCIVVPLASALMFSAPGSGRQQGGTSAQLPQTAPTRRLWPSHPAPPHKAWRVSILSPHIGGCQGGAGHRGDRGTVWMSGVLPQPDHSFFARMSPSVLPRLTHFPHEPDGYLPLQQMPGHPHLSHPSAGGA